MLGDEEGGEVVPRQVRGGDAPIAGPDDQVVQIGEVARSRVDRKAPLHRQEGAELAEAGAPSQRPAVLGFFMRSGAGHGVFLH